MAINIGLTVHPGDWLRTEMVEPYGLNVSTAAKALGVTRQAMSNLLNGHAAVSPEMAIRFEKAFGLRAETLIRMQANYDIRIARMKADQIKVDRVAMAA